MSGSDWYVVKFRIAHQPNDYTTLWHWTQPPSLNVPADAFALLTDHGERRVYWSVIKVRLPAAGSPSGDPQGKTITLAPYSEERWFKWDR